MNITLTDTERAEMNCDCRWAHHETDSCFVPVVQRILAARYAEWRKEGEAIARGMVEQALREQHEEIVEALSNEPAARATWDDGTEFIAVDSAARIVREWGAR